MIIRVNVYPLLSNRIGIVVKTYTSCDENVYVSSVKRIRFRHETYTYSGERNGCLEKVGMKGEERGEPTSTGIVIEIILQTFV